MRLALFAGVLASSCCLGEGSPLDLAPPLPPWAPDVPTLSRGTDAPAITSTLALDADTILVSSGTPNDTRTLASGVYLVSASTGTVRSFVPADAALLARLTSGTPVVRRGDGVVWVAPYDTESGIHLLASDGSFPRLFATSSVYSFFFDHDGSHVAFSTFRGDVDPAGSYLTVAALPSDAAEPTPQIAEEHMAFVAGDRLVVNAGTDLVLTTRAGTDTRVLAPGWRAYDTAASPDGSRVVFHGGELAHALSTYLMDGSGENRRSIDDGNGGAILWSADGAYFATLVTRNDGPATSVRVFDRDGARVATITLPPPNDPDPVTQVRHEGITRFAFSPDASHLALLVDLGSACSTPMVGGCDCDPFLYLVARDGSGLTRVTDRMFACGAAMLW